MRNVRRFAAVAGLQPATWRNWPVAALQGHNWPVAACVGVNRVRERAHFPHTHARAYTHICVKRAIARAPRRAARRRRDSPNYTFLCTDPPSALAVTAAGASYVARAVPSDSVSCMLGAQRVPTDRFKRDVPAQGELTRIRPANLLSAPRCVASLQTCRDRENLQSKNRRLHCG
eukprot:scaffold12286_cov84-Phaeocystis_antarctica.AAC.1